MELSFLTGKGIVAGDITLIGQFLQIILELIMHMANEEEEDMKDDEANKDEDQNSPEKVEDWMKMEEHLNVDNIGQEDKDEDMWDQIDKGDSPEK